MTRWEAERESTLLANPINHLRRHLRVGESCPVCGAIEHPYASDVQPENTERLESVEHALGKAKEVAGRVHRRRETLEGEKIRVNQEKIHIGTQAKETHEKTTQLDI